MTTKQAGRSHPSTGGSLRVWRESAVAWHASTVAILAVAGWLIFRLPWHVPVPTEIQSDAAELGFSNTAANLAVALTLAVLFVRRMLTPRVAASDAALFHPLVVPATRATAIECVVLAVCIAVSWGVVVAWWTFAPESYFGESAYFLTRLDMMTLGKLPYRDFDYGYGPSLLWLPFLIHRAAGSLLAIDTAYIVTLLLHIALGLLATASILRRLAVSPGARIAILVFVALATLNLMLGVIYTSLRFVYALWGILLFDAAQRGGSDRTGWMAAFLVPLGGLLISPEIGVVSIVACLTWLATAAWCGRPTLARRALAIVAAALAVRAVFGAGMLRFFAAFGSGAFNFPFLPIPYSICLLGLAFWLLPAMAAAGVRVVSDTSPILVSLVVTIGLFLPAAFGRCDPTHVLFNGLGLILISLAANAAPSRRWQAAATSLATAVICATYLGSTWNFYGPNVNASLETRMAILSEGRNLRISDARVLRAITNPDTRFAWAKRLSFQDDLVELLRYERIGTPLGCHEQIDRFLKVAGLYAPEYHVPPYGGATNPAAVKRTVEDAGRTDILLVPDWSPTALRPFDIDRHHRWEESFLSSLFVWPVHLPAPRHVWRAEILTLQQLSLDYDQVGTFRNMLVLRRNKPR